MTKLWIEDAVSNCCQASVTDSWLCSDCKEHCSKVYAGNVSVWVLDYQYTKVYRLIIPIEYNDYDFNREDAIGKAIADYVWHGSTDRMYTDDKEIDFEDLDLT